MNPAPDVILLDLRMPVMGGVEVLSRLADQKFGGEVILMSGVDEDTLHSVEKLTEGSLTQVLGSLSKPPIASELAELLYLLVKK